MRAFVALYLALAAAAPSAAEAQRGDRWQLTLNSGKTFWDLRLVKLTGDTLVVQDVDSLRAFPIAQIDELRLVQKSKRSITPEAGRYGGVLGGADDEIYRLTLYNLTERRQILRQIFERQAP